MLERFFAKEFTQFSRLENIINFTIWEIGWILFYAENWSNIYFNVITAIENVDQDSFYRDL